MEVAGRGEVVLPLELLHRLGKRFVVALAVAGDSEAMAHQRHAGIVHAGLEHRPAADARRTSRIAVAGSRLAELGAEGHVGPTARGSAKQRPPATPPRRGAAARMWRGRR